MAKTATSKKKPRSSGRQYGAPLQPCAASADLTVRIATADGHAAKGIAVQVKQRIPVSKRTDADGFAFFDGLENGTATVEVQVDEADFEPWPPLAVTIAKGKKAAPLMVRLARQTAGLRNPSWSAEKYFSGQAIELCVEAPGAADGRVVYFQIESSTDASQWRVRQQARAAVSGEKARTRIVLDDGGLEAGRGAFRFHASFNPAAR